MRVPLPGGNDRMLAADGVSVMSTRIQSQSITHRMATVLVGLAIALSFVGVAVHQAPPAQAAVKVGPLDQFRHLKPWCERQMMGRHDSRQRQSGQSMECLHVEVSDSGVLPHCRYRHERGLPELLRRPHLGQAQQSGMGVVLGVLAKLKIPQWTSTRLVSDRQPGQRSSKRSAPAPSSEKFNLRPFSVGRSMFVPTGFIGIRSPVLPSSDQTSPDPLVSYGVSHPT